MIRFDYEGSARGAVWLSILLALVLSVFLNLAAAASTLTTQSVETASKRLNLQAELMERIHDTSLSEDLKQKSVEVASSEEMDALLSRYVTYLSEYLLEGKSDKEIKEQDLVLLLAPYVQRWTSEDLPPESLESQTQMLVKEMKLTNVFAPASTFFPGQLAERIGVFQSERLRSIGTISLVVLGLLLVLVATPRRVAFFASFVCLSGGLLAGAVGEAGLWMVTSLFTNPMIIFLLDEFQQSLTMLKKLTLLLSGMLLLVGLFYVVLILVLRNRRLAVALQPTAPPPPAV